MKWRALIIDMVGLVAAMSGCNEAAGIYEGVSRGTVACSALTDCLVDVPECRPESTCEDGVCVFRYAIEGTPLGKQTPSDCAAIVCNGAGSTELIPSATDSPCLLRTCGDGIVQNGETCDDGNTNDGDVCPGSCLRQVAQVAASGYKTCALRIDRRIKCWGGVNPQVGDDAGELGDVLPTVELGTSELAIAVAVGYYHMCAMLRGGRIKCWGGWENGDGQLGLGDTEIRGDEPGEMGDNLPVVDLGPGKKVIALAAGGYHTCALLEGGSVKCWGNGSDGQLGLGDTEIRGDEPGEMGDNLPVVELGPGKKVTALAAGGYHTCALLEDGSVKCWGKGSDGQLGLGDTDLRGDEPGEMGDNLPVVELGPGKKAVALAAGGEHTCALLEGGSVKCWGQNFAGQLGLGEQQYARGDEPDEMGDNLPMVDLGPGKKVVALAAGGAHTCALLEGGSVKCWGLGGHGELGLGDEHARGNEPGEMGDSLPVVDLGAGRKATAIAGSLSHTCALLDDGRMKCWGSNQRGQLGLGDTFTRGDEPGEMGDNLPDIAP